MTHYDFKTLDDKEFESLCADILGTASNMRFERFKRGKDGGVDARCFVAEGEVVLQCKHWVNTPVEQLIRHLERSEKPKVARLKPARYLLAVSNPLSRTDKAAIRDALAPFLASDSDIYGNEDLSDLLAKHDQIERRHYKLWLTSASVLSHIFNKPIFDRSGFSVEEALAFAKRYVQTSNHNRALEMLDLLHAVIITGEPGIGKTTLAEHLCLHYVSNGFELVKLAAEIREAEAVFDPSKQQVFYFDDFLGRNYLQALSGHEGNLIVSFIQRVKRDHRKRFILTSRSTILNQGRVLIDNFHNKNIDKNEFELKIGSLTEMDRARILYSHIWHSTLSPEFVDEIYKEKRYRTVVSHRNYNPRLVEFITDSNRLENCAPGSYWNHVKQTLENPADIWGNALDAQQDDFGRALVLLVTLEGRAVQQSELAEAYNRYISAAENHSMSGRRDFWLNLRHLTGSLLSRRITNANAADATINLFNPSIADFVLRRYAADVPTIRSAFLSLRSSSSLRTLADLCKNEIISELAYADVLRDILRRASGQRFVGFDAEYLSMAAWALVSMVDRVVRDDRAVILEALDFVKREEAPRQFWDAAKFLHWGLINAGVDEAVILSFVVDACEQNPTNEEIEALVALRDALPSDGPAFDEVSETIASAAVAYLIDNLDEEFEESDVFDGVGYGDVGEGCENLKTLIDRWFDDADIHCSWHDAQEIIDSYDVDSRMHDYFKASAQRSTISRGPTSSGHDVDEMDDLFDRS